MSNNTQHPQLSSIPLKVQRNSLSTSQKGTITLKLSAEDTKRFIVSQTSNNKERIIKLPFKIKLSSNSSDPNNPNKFSAKLVLKSQEKSSHEDLPKIEKLHTNSYELKASNDELALPPSPQLYQQASQVGQPNSVIASDENEDIFPQPFVQEEELSRSPVQLYPQNFTWKHIHQFFAAIIDQINGQQVYGTLMDRRLIIEILHSKTQFFVNTEQTQQLLSLVLDYMSLSKNRGNKVELHTHYQLRNFAQVMGSEWHRLYSEIFTSNKNILKILDYIQPKSQNEGSRYTHCYLDLKFDFSQDQLSKVSQAVKYQCRYNHKAFCFLTNYLFKCCRKLEQKNACIRQIQDELVSALIKLIKENPPSHSLQGGSSLLFHHPSFQLDSSEYPYQYLNLKNVPKVNKIKVLENFIEMRAKDAQRSSIGFSKLIKDTCSKEGSNLTIGVKIKSMKMKKAIHRVKEKILDKISSNHRSEITLNVNPNLSIDHYTNQQFQQYKERLNSIYTSLEENIQFGVDDLLRGRCIFSNIDTLNSCCSQLKKEIQKRGFKLLALQNRLKQQTCDIILHIQIGKTIAQLQLVINYKLAQNQFNYKLNHLKKTQFYNHLTHLKLYNDKMTYLFLEEAFKYIEANKHSNKQINYNQKTDFERTANNLKQFIGILPFKVNTEDIDTSDNDILLLSHLIHQFDQIKSKEGTTLPEPCFEINKHNGDYTYELRNYNEAQHFQQQFCKQVEAKYAELLAKTHQSHYFLDEEKNILKNYAGALNILGKIYMQRKQYQKAIKMLEQSERLTLIVGNRDEFIAETLKNLGEIQYKRGNLTKSIEIYNNLLTFQEQFKQSDQYVQTLMSLAEVYKHQGNFNQSEAALKKCLDILQKQKGRECILLATVYNHLGATYNLQGILPQSLINYKASLEIIEKEKGKNSFDCASILGNIALIYQHDGSYYEAIKHYEKSVLICSKHNVREGIYANSLFGLGKCYSALKNHSKAIEYFQQSLVYFQKNRGQMYYTTLTDIATSYEHLGEVEQANHYYNLLQA